ncbi:hypothetical protein F4677DRAFT_453740 [Hypoxylon crocopeplum]|nr:hypothetical protein F4677DRAFT_453740 [Hypoxylon crocopeplum]
MLQTPPPSSHPVLIARKLLMLGIYLQGFSPSITQELNGLSIPHHNIMHCAVETASRLVTSDDDLAGTIEGIECIMMESMYHNNGGNLRRAYLTIRRALVIAQMIGLDRGSNLPLLKVLEPATRIRIDPELMWFRIIQSDRYLSLMLGLPPGTTDNSFATAKMLEGCSPMERMERIESAAGGRIIQRKDADMHDLKVTQEIDTMFQDAAASMPPQWWLAPDLSSRASDDLEAIHDTVRLMDQFAHYHMLQRLHLPYLLHPSTDPKYDYSKITAVMASRELLSRFVPFRSSDAFSSFCRGVDFLAFIASTALCLAHVDARRQKRGRVDEGGALLSCLSHQRLSDRGMMERVLEIMEHIARTSADRIAGKIAGITRHLLAIEADAAMGGSYRTDSSYGTGGEELECNGKISDGGTMLRVYIPYLGTIKIERHDVSRSSMPAPILADPRSPGTPRPTPSFDPLASLGPPLPSERPAGHEQDRVTPENCLADCPTNIQPLHRPAQDDDAFASTIPDAQWLVPGLDLGDDVDLQGVDMAFFDSLFRFCDAE